MPPRIVTARSMGLQFRANQLARMGPEKSVVGHYSAGARARDFKAGIARAKSFHSFHLSKGWAGIGYHYVIPDDGAIVCCRSTSHVGAHVLNKNSGRIGVNMPGTTGDRPTKRQARAFHWLLHHAHTSAMPRAHRTDRDLSRVPRFGHKDLMATSCPGLFLGMYRRGGDPWIEPSSDALDPGLLMPDPGFEPLPEPPLAEAPGGSVEPILEDDGFADLEPEDEEFLAFIESARDLAPAADDTFGPDAAELEKAGGAEALELPPPDVEFDEDLGDVLAEIEAEPNPVR